MAPGARSKFDAHMFAPEVFRKQMHCIEKLLGTFRHLRSNSVPGELCPPALAGAISQISIIKMTA